MSEAFREKRCTCHECESAHRLRELLKEKDAKIGELESTLAAILELMETFRFRFDPISEGLVGPLVKMR